MLRYVLKRVLIGIVTLFVLASVTFFLMKATPGSPINGEKYKTEEAYQAAMEKYNLDKPVFEQYLIYIEDLAHGNLGESMVQEYLESFVRKTLTNMEFQVETVSYIQELPFQPCCLP